MLLQILVCFLPFMTKHFIITWEALPMYLYAFLNSKSWELKECKHITVVHFQCVKLTFIFWYCPRPRTPNCWRGMVEIWHSVYGWCRQYRLYQCPWMFEKHNKMIGYFIFKGAIIMWYKFSISVMFYFSYYGTNILYYDIFWTRW